MIESAAEDLADEVDEGTEVDEGFLEVEVVKPDVVGEGDAPEEPEADIAPVGEARGAVDCPLIWFWTVVLKVPVILSNVNLEEKAIAGYWGVSGSLALRDSRRMKYWELFGPMVASMTASTLLTFETSTLELRV